MPDGQWVRQKPVDPRPAPCPGLLALFHSISSSLTPLIYGRMWVHIRTEQFCCFVNLQCRLFARMTLILSCLKNRCCFLIAPQAHMWYRKCSGTKQKAAENPGGGGGGGVSFKVEKGVMFTLEIFIYQGVCLKVLGQNLSFCFKGAGRYQKWKVMEC